ncbi:MAG: hypothetical protein HY610_02415 [Elusimicrobia bacterium]|nr:hypothetical protein [Elusimicrobiota bacterium]
MRNLTGYQRFAKHFGEELKCHFTFSQKRLMQQYISEICARQGIPFDTFFLNGDLQRLLRAPKDPVHKGKEIFRWIQGARYPLSQGKAERLEKSDQDTRSLVSKGVRDLDSRKKLINPYFYGAGIYDLREHVLSLIRSCPLDCAYCFLREVYDDPKTKVPPDFLKIEQELDQLTAQEKGVIYLNAGENADSMILDTEFGLVRKLWKIVKPHDNVFLEFRTKTDKVQNVIAIQDPGNRLVLAFSLNPEVDRTVFESSTATIAARLRALQILQEKGFLLGLRFEPILYTKDYLKKYRQLFAEVFSAISPQSVHSVAFGCLRLTKGLAKILRRTHPHVLAEEWILGVDKKMRYCGEVRTVVYKNLIQTLQDYFPFPERTVLSTEPISVWNESGLNLKTMPQISMKVSV